MSQVAPASPRSVEPYRWEIPLRPRVLDHSALTASTMTAAEQMFFLGAPLAHVIEYEKALHIRRVKGPQRSAGRLTRIAIRRFVTATGGSPELALAD